MPKPISPVEITPATPSDWVDVDVTSHVGADAGNIAGVILQVVSTTVTEYSWGVRKNGSTDILTRILEDNSHNWIAVGVDDNDIFEINIGDVTNIDVYLVGYVTKSEGSFFANAINKSLGTTGSWLDIDISGDTGADTAKVAFLLVDEGASPGSVNWGLRENGSTDTRRPTDVTSGFSQYKGAMIGVDANEIFEMIVGDLAQDCYLLGYLKANVTTFANAKNYSTGTAGSYVDVDVSADVPAGNNGVFWHGWNSNNGAIEVQFGIRKKGETYDFYQDFSVQQHGWAELDANRVFQQKIETTFGDLFIWGYTSTPAVASQAADMGNVIIQHSRLIHHQ